jgi:maltose-binding protein MalE
VQAENIYLSSQAKGAHLEASLDFIDHFLSPESQTQLTDIGLIPTSSEVQIVNVTTGHLYNQAIAALAGGVTYPVKPEMEIYATQMEIALKSFYDGTPAEDVLQAAESTINELLSQFQVTSTPEMTPTP